MLRALGRHVSGDWGSVCLADAEANEAAVHAWLRESIEQEEALLRSALKQVLRERHGRLPSDEGGATLRAMAWSHLLARRCQLRALRELTRRLTRSFTASAPSSACSDSTRPRVVPLVSFLRGDAARRQKGSAKGIRTLSTPTKSCSTCNPWSSCATGTWTEASRIQFFAAS